MMIISRYVVFEEENNWDWGTTHVEDSFANLNSNDDNWGANTISKTNKDEVETNENNGENK